MVPKGRRRQLSGVGSQLMGREPAARTCAFCGAVLASDNQEQVCGPCARTNSPIVGPPDVPAWFWAVDHMQKALGTWHMGKVLAAYRTHPYHRRPISQTVAGGWVGLGQSEVSRLETGPPVGSMDKLLLWARTLQIPPQLLWFKVPEADRPVAGSGQRDVTPALTSEVSPVVPDVERSFPALNVDELDQLSRGLEQAGYFDNTSVAFLDRQLQRCAANDGSKGPRQALPTVLALLATIVRSARDVRPRVRADFVRLGTRAAEMAGWLYRDLGSTAGAEYWRDRAFEWAAELGDLPMCGYVLLRKSQSAWDDRDASRMLALANAAGATTWQLPDKVQAEVAQQQARGHAMLGSPRQIVDRKLDEAWRLLAEPNESSTDLGAGYTEMLLTIQTAICQCEVGDAARAVELYGVLLDTPSFSRRDRGYFLALRAFACERAGEPDEAARTASEAMAIATPTASGRTLAELRRLSDGLSLWADRPLVREFRETLQSVS